MKYLQSYITNKNQMLAMFNPRFGRAQYTFPLSQNDVDSIAQDLDCQASPENLRCDGEVSARVAATKLANIEMVYKDLEAYCLKNWLDTPVVYEI